MKAILFDGNEIQTADEIADALVQYACALASHRQTDEVTIPIARGGAVVDCMLCLGAAVVWATYPVPEADLIVVPGAADTAHDLHERRERLGREWVGG